MLTELVVTNQQELRRMDILILELERQIDFIIVVRQIYNIDNPQKYYQPNHSTKGEWILCIT